MITLIAEKPSVGMELARATGCRDRHDGYMSGGFLDSSPCRVTWSFGHLCTIEESEEENALRSDPRNLPVMPQRFRLVPGKNEKGETDQGYVKQLKVIEGLFASSDLIVNCGDAGREGELIQRRILEYVTLRNAACAKPVKRLWISSLTDEAIREGLRNLRPSSEFDNLYHAGKARAEADWLVGINASNALKAAVARKFPDIRRSLSLGRVQTPVLALVCRRWYENQDFKPVPFWTVKIVTEKDGMTFTVVSDKRYESAAEASAVAQTAMRSPLLVTKAEHQARIVKPPLLFDQTSAQQEASKRYDMDPDETLTIIQKLYEHKLVTYPRTGSRFISRDVLKTIKGRMAALASNTQDPQLRSAATMMSAPETRFNMRSVNDGKVTDHHALLIERTVPHGLSEKEQRIYDLIALRMLEAFAPPCEEDVYKCVFTCAGEPFHASHTRTVIPGWKAISGRTVEMETSPEDEPSKPLPRMDAGDALPVLKSEDARGETKPRPLYTFESLLEAMKTAGKESDDDEVKAALKDIGIGTAATRAEILKTLMDKRKYIRKSGKKIVPTETGLEVYGIVKDMTICDVDLTGRWEVALSYIADGAMAPDLFDARIRDYTRYITLQVLAADPGDGIRKAAEAENVKCPLCGGLVKVWDNGARCTNTACGLYVNRTVFGKKLSESTVKFLLEHGKTGIVKGLVSQKTGKTFEARLKLTVTEKDGRKYGNATPVFDDRKPEYRKYSNK